MTRTAGHRLEKGKHRMDNDSHDTTHATKVASPGKLRKRLDGWWASTSAQDRPHRRHAAHDLHPRRVRQLCMTARLAHARMRAQAPRQNGASNSSLRRPTSFILGSETPTSSEMLRSESAITRTEHPR